MSAPQTSRTDDMPELAAQAVALARKHGAGEAAATSSRSRDVEVTWRDGRLEKVTEAITRDVSLQLYVDGRYSSVSTSDLRPAALEQFVKEAIVMTRALAVDEHRRLPEPELYAGRSTEDLDLVDPAQVKLTADERQAYARQAEEAARAADPRGRILSVTTGFGDAQYETHRVASNGFTGTQRGTSFSASASVSVRDPDGRRPEEYHYGSARYRADLPDAATIGRLATERTLGRIGAAKAKSARLTMAVENRAAGRLVSMLLGPMRAQALQQKQSFLDGKLGKKLGSDRLDLADDPLVRRGLGSRHYDGEGLTARRMPLFDGGVLKTFFIDTYYGRKLGARPTSGGASNLSWKLGSKDQAGLLADLGNGILVTGFLGGNSNGATGDFSLGIQGFHVRKGRIAEPVAEMNIAGNQADFWKRLVAVGNDPWLSSSMRTPTLVFEGIDFAGV